MRLELMDVERLKQEIDLGRQFPGSARPQTGIRKVDAARAYLLVTNRNAWQWTTSRTYSPDAAVHTTLAAAMQTAEQLRLQGSWFSIQETASLAIQTEKSTLLVLQNNTANPFLDWHPFHVREQLGRFTVHAVTAGMTPMALVGAFLRQSPHWSAPAHVLHRRRVGNEVRCRIRFR